MRSTRITRPVKAPRASVYRALLDPRAVATWMVPTGMTGHLHSFEGREGEEPTCCHGTPALHR